MSETGTPGKVALTEGLGLVPERWYVVSVDGRATLCADEADARNVERECNTLYPRHGPHRAVFLGDVAAERERCGRLVHTLSVSTEFSDEQSALIYGIEHEVKRPNVGAKLETTAAPK